MKIVVFFKLHHGTTTKSGHCKFSPNKLPIDYDSFHFLDTAYTLTQQDTLIHFNDVQVSEVESSVIESTYIQVYTRITLIS